MKKYIQPILVLLMAVLVYGLGRLQGQSDKIIDTQLTMAEIKQTTQYEAQKRAVEMFENDELPQSRLDLYAIQHIIYGKTSDSNQLSRLAKEYRSNPIDIEKMMKAPDDW